MAIITVWNILKMKKLNGFSATAKVCSVAWKTTEDNVDVDRIISRVSKNPFITCEIKNGLEELDVSL